MPSAITHGFVGIIGNKIFSKTSSLKFWIVSILCPIIPDFDVIAFKFGIPYEHMFGHRGFTHSILFAFLLSVLVVSTVFREIKPNTKIWYSFLIFFFVIVVSHPLLDAFTSGGLGVGFFIPFDQTRYFFPFRPIKVSPFSISKFFYESGYKIMLSEILWVWIPLVGLFGITKTIKKMINAG